MSGTTEEPKGPGGAVDPRGQRALKLWGEQVACLEVFEPAANPDAVRYLDRDVSAYKLGNVLVWGPRGVGKTHLLLASCRAAAAQRAQASYLDLAACRTAGPPDPLAGLAALDFVCLDNLNAVAGARPWLIGLVDLIERAAQNGTRLLFAAPVPPARLELGLPDLESRLARALVFRLAPLDEAATLRALRTRARARGFDLPEPAARFLLNRLPRDMPALCAAVDRLDVESLRRQRRITIPVIKDILGL